MFFDYTGGGSTGLVIRDANGMLIRAQAQWYRVASGAQMMELLAIRDGIQISKDLGHTRICIESDAKEMVDMCNSEISERSAFAAICHEIKELIEGFNSCVLTFVHREANEAAHRCAKQATKDRRRCLWINYMPSFLADCTQFSCNPPT